MPSPTNPFPRSAMSSTWLAIVSALQTDPTLNSRVNLWQVWTGEEADLVDVGADDLPYIRITPSGGNQQWLDEQTHEFIWVLDVQVGVEGTDITALLDFWAAIHTALFTGNTLLNQLVSFGVIQKTIISPATTPKLYDGTSGLDGKGQLRIKMRIQS